MAFDAGAVIGRLELNIAGWQQSVQTVIDKQKELEVAFKAGAAPVGQFADLLKQYGLQTAPQSAAMIEKLRGQQTQLDTAYKSGLINLGAYQKGSQDVANQLKELEGVTERAKNKTELFNEKMTKIGPTMKTVGRTFTVVGGAIVASLGAMVKKTADYGDEMDEMSQRTGAGVELLTGLDGALRKNGASAGDLAVGMKFLSSKMVDANSGNKEAIALFKGLGISVTDANGNLRSTTDVLFDVATRFSGMEDGAIKTTAAVDLLGRGGMSLIPTLNLGADGLKREADEASRLGKVMTAEAAKACSDFNDSLVDLKGGLQGVGIQIGTALMPMVQGLVVRVTNIIVKVREWAAAHPGLTEGLSKTALGLGALAMTIGPVLIALPSLVKWIQALKAISATPIIITIMVAIPVIAKAISDFNSELQNMRDSMKEAGSSGFVAFLEGVNSGWRRVALGIKDSNIVLSEANALANLYAKEGGKGTKDILLEEVGVAEKFTSTLQEVKKATTEVIETWAPMAAGASFVRDVMQGFAGELTTTFIPAAKNMELVMAAAPGTFSEAGDAASGLDYVFKALGDSIGVSAATVVVAMYNIRAAVLSSMGIIVPALEMPDLSSKVKSTMDEVSTVVADAMRDIARSIVEVLNLKELLGAAPKKLTFDSSYYDAMVDAANSAYDALVATTKTAYSAMEAAANKSYDAAVNAANNAYDKQEERIKLHQQIEDNQRAWHETFEDRKIARQDEREDRAIQRQYDRDDAKFARQHQKEVDAINNSTMTAAQKEAALAALERKYEHEKEVRERQRQHAADVLAMKRQHEADVRQRAREHAELVRDLARQRAKEARELAHEKKLEALELAHERRLEAIKVAELAKLLGLQNAHQADLDKIRRAEDLARKKQADDEEKRQKSLWYKVKGIFATAVEQMLTIWLTRFVTGLVSGTATAATGISNIVSGAATSLATILTTLATTIGTIITTIFTAIGTAIVTLATAIGAAAVAIAVAIGTVIVTLATAVATAATILAAAAPAFVIVGLIAVGIFATIALLKRLIAGAGGTGAGDGMGRVVERQDIQIGLLTMIRDTLNAGGNIKTTLWTISGHTVNLASIKLSNWVISTTTQVSRDFLRTIAHYQTLSAGYLKTIASTNYLKDVVGYLKEIAANTKNIPGAAYGALVMEPSFMRVAEHEPEVISHLADYRAGNLPGAGMGAGGQAVNHYHIAIQAIDGPSVERLFKGKGREIIDDMFRQNKGGLTRHVNKWLDAMA